MPQAHGRGTNGRLAGKFLQKVLQQVSHSPIDGCPCQGIHLPKRLDTGSLGKVVMGTGKWAPLKQAAAELGSTITAVRKRAKRGGLLLSRDNTGRLLVWLEDREEGHHDGAQDAHEIPKAVGMSNLPTSAQGGHPVEANLVPIAKALEMVSESVRQERSEHHRQQDQMRADHAAELARISNLHLELFGRLQAQAATERSLFLERVDAAELRAEAAEARAAAVDEKLHQVLDRLLDRRPEPSSTPDTPCQRRLRSPATSRAADPRRLQFLSYSLRLK